MSLESVALEWDRITGTILKLGSGVECLLAGSSVVRAYYGGAGGEEVPTVFVRHPRAPPLPSGEAAAFEEWLYGVLDTAWPCLGYRYSELVGCFVDSPGSEDLFSELSVTPTMREGEVVLRVVLVHETEARLHDVLVSHLDTDFDTLAWDGHRLWVPQYLDLEKRLGTAVRPQTAMMEARIRRWLSRGFRLVDRRDRELEYSQPLRLGKTW